LIWKLIIQALKLLNKSIRDISDTQNLNTIACENETRQLSTWIHHWEFKCECFNLQE